MNLLPRCRFLEYKYKGRFCAVWLSQKRCDRVIERIIEQHDDSKLVNGNNMTTTNGREKELVVVGIGASAGGLQALELFFDQMPSDSGMAFVIVQHLSPDFKSLMTELLGRHTSMEIHRVENSMVVEPNSLYLIPPKQDMIIKDGRLLLTERAPSRSLALPIDHFFQSLAVDKGANSIGIVLSGTGSDGSRGIQHIHEVGGLVIAQQPESAKFDGMPRSAIESGYTDVVVDAGQMATLLKQYAVHRDRVALRNEMLPLNESAMERIFRAIQQRHRIDFSQYRSTTIGRRIERRIDMDSSIDSIKQYADLLENDTIELDQLHSDLLIGVTNFFRDTSPFESLKKNSLKTLLANHPSDQEFRVWVAACATGEEAYSIAILIDECLRESPRSIDVKVFATDVHRVAINKAAAGVYSEDLVKGISAERLAKYFMQVEGGYQIVPAIRQMVVFAPHNLVNDPPFTRLSLVTCRNFLIYLMPKTQAKVISHFHFGLNKGGYLLLGSSESPGDLAAEFEAVDAHNRIYMKTRDLRIRDPGFTESLVQTSASVNRFFPIMSPNRVPPKESLLALSNKEVLSNLVPPGIVVDHLGRVLQVFRNAGKYLRVSDGLLSMNLMDMVDDELRLALGGAIQRSTKSGRPVCYERLQIETADDQDSQVKLTVTPLPRNDTPKKFVITFEQLRDDFSKEAISNQTRQIELDEVSKKHVEDLEQDLKHNREILQATTEEMETSNEELQATNEELVASNEELQSANEELHSVNEELFTVNAEYQRKISELTELTHDFDNLLESTDIHTLFLDAALCIRKFTPRMADVLHLVPQDVGRRIDAFVHNINTDDLRDKLSAVLKTGQAWEESIKGSGETEFLMRVLPYKAGLENVGVVLTLIDVSKLAAAQRVAALERERFQRAIEANRDGTWDWPDLTKQDMWWSPRCYEILGYERDEFPSMHSEWMQRIHPEDRVQIEGSSLPTSDKCYVALHRNFDYRMLHKSGEYRWYCHRAIIDFDESGKAIRMTGTIADIQDRKSSETLAHEGIRLRDNFLSMLSHELRNPMGAVMNAVTNLNGDVDTQDSETPVELAVIRRQTLQMARLLDDLFDVARLGRDKIEFRKEIVDLCSLVDSVIESVDYQLEARKQVLKTSICEGPLHVIGDPSRISQSQTNLIVNASKFSDEFQEITFSIHREGREAVITVIDQGAGIEPHMLESVFGLFFQSDNTLERPRSGMGVGLSLTQKIIHAHNGTVTAESDGTGQGSKFEIRLPITTLHHDKREPAQDLNLDRTLTCKVMLVEDNADAREMMGKTFRRRGFEVLAVGDGKAAIDELPEFGAAVVVVDIGLPGISGYDVAKTIRQNQLWDDVMLVALTGYGQKEDRDAVFESGFDHHIVKPLIFRHLHDLILHHLSRSK